MRGPHLVVLLLLAAASGTAVGHGTPNPGAPSPNPAAEDSTFGRPGDSRRVSRRVRVEMSDTMRFTPAVLEIRRGETVRFTVVNRGRTLHEMVLGTLEGLREHAALMQKFPNMQHDEPNTVHVAPGKTGTLTWQFSRAGEFRYGCLVPGHFEAGMAGRIVVR